MSKRRSGKRNVHHSRWYFRSYQVSKKNIKINEWIYSFFLICFCSSETGHVLTIMKAGDFFGEIGILNLDGFNKYLYF